MIKVIPGSASDLGGLRQGDYIVGIDGSKANAMQIRELVQYINTKKSHAVMMFEVLPKDSNEVQTLWIHRFLKFTFSFRIFTLSAEMQLSPDRVP